MTPEPPATRSEAETLAWGERLVDELDPDALLLLEGDLGAGKTVVVRGIARGLGVDPNEVQSPTFTLVHEHRGERGRLVHVDLYRLDPADLDALGLDELLEGPGIKAVEWAERLSWTPAGARRLRLRVEADGARTFHWVPR